MDKFISKFCKGEKCTICGNPAVEKIAQVVFDDDPNPGRHELTSYLCRKHFNDVMGKEFSISEFFDIFYDIRETMRGEKVNGMINDHKYFIFKPKFEDFTYGLEAFDDLETSKNNFYDRVLLDDLFRNFYNFSVAFASSEIIYRTTSVGNKYPFLKKEIRSYKHCIEDILLNHRNMSRYIIESFYKQI